MIIMKKVKKVLATTLSLALVCGAATSLVSCGDKADFTVGICQIAPHEALDAATKGFKDALKEAMDEAGKTVKFDDQNAQNDTTACSTIINSFVSSKVDLIMANATPVLQAASNATETIPILGTSVTEYGVALEIDNFSGTTGINVSGTSDLAPLEEQANMLMELVPTAQKVGLLYCSAEPNSVYQVEVVGDVLEDAGLEVRTFPFGDSNDLQTVCQSAVAFSDVIYVPTDNTVASNTSIIDNVCRGGSKKVPVFAGEEGICRGCGFATLSISYYNLGRKTGEMAARILLEGEDITTMAIEYDAFPVKKFNAEICDELGIEIPSDYLAIV